MTQISNPPAFPQAGTRSKSLAIAIVAALVLAIAAAAVAVSKVRAPRHATLTQAPPSYQEALKQAEAEDLAKGVTPELAAELRAKGAVPPVRQAGQF